MEGFAVTCPLAPDAPRLISGFCSSPRSFGFSFLQTPPRGDALAVSLAFGSAKTWLSDSHLHSYVPCSAHTTELSGRRRAMRDGYPGATLLGAPLEPRVGAHLAFARRTSNRPGSCKWTRTRRLFAFVISINQGCSGSPDTFRPAGSRHNSGSDIKRDANTRSFVSSTRSIHSIRNNEQPRGAILGSANTRK